MRNTSINQLKELTFCSDFIVENTVWNIYDLKNGFLHRCIFTLIWIWRLLEVTVFDIFSLFDLNKSNILMSLLIWILIGFVDKEYFIFNLFAIHGDHILNTIQVHSFQWDILVDEVASLFTQLIFIFLFLLIIFFEYLDV